MFFQMKKTLKILGLLVAGAVINDLIKRAIYHALYRQVLEQYSDNIHRSIDTGHFE